jgi:predicted dehydrogenase
LNHKTGTSIPEIAGQQITPEKKEPLQMELRSFIGATQGKNPVECTGQEGRRALSLAVQILEQAEKAQALEIDRQ